MKYLRGYIVQTSNVNKGVCPTLGVLRWKAQLFYQAARPLAGVLSPLREAYTLKGESGHFS